MNILQIFKKNFDVRNYILRKSNLILELNDATYTIDIYSGLVKHTGGRYSELIHNNIIKEVCKKL